MDDDQFVEVEQTIDDKSQENKQKIQPFSEKQEQNEQKKYKNQSEDVWITSQQAQDNKQTNIEKQNENENLEPCIIEDIKTSLDMEVDPNINKVQIDQFGNEVHSQGFIQVEGELVSKQNIPDAASQGFLQIKGNLASRNNIQINDDFLQIEGQLVSKQNLQSINSFPKQIKQAQKGQENDDVFEFVQAQSKAQQIYQTIGINGSNNINEQNIQILTDKLQGNSSTGINNDQKNSGEQIFDGYNGNQANQAQASKHQQDQFAQGQYQQSSLNQEQINTCKNQRGQQQQVQMEYGQKDKQKDIETEKQENKKQEQQQDFGDFEQQTQTMQQEQKQQKSHEAVTLEKQQIKQDYSGYCKQVQQFLYKLPDYSFMTTGVFL